MKFLSLLILIFLPYFSIGQVENMRVLFFDASSDQGIKGFYNNAQLLDESTPILKAYKGVATAMQAEVASSVSEKLDYFNKGKALLETALASDWYNAEIRFLRFSVQSEVPFILGYADKLDEDAAIIIEAFRNNSIDKTNDFWKRAIQFMVDSGELSDENKKEVEKYKT